MSSVDNRTVTLKEAESRIVRAFKLKRPLFVWGPPGIGKSELFMGIRDKQTLGTTLLIDVRAALMEPTDVRGFPAPDVENGQMIWLPPTDFPSQELAAKYDTVILFLDELNSAAQAVQADVAKTTRCSSL